MTARPNPLPEPAAADNEGRPVLRGFTVTVRIKDQK